MEQEIASTKRYFSLHSITLSNEWLESCIEWYKEENPGSNYTLDTLHKKVYEQWLLLDLRETEVAILPPHLSDQQKMILNGAFSLQLMYVTDISQPKLQQLQKIRNMVPNTTEDEYPWNTSSKRMLRLVLTDGVQEVEAMEYKPIPVLNLNLTPGTKIKICGPVTVRRGQLMLEERNIEIMGGEVEELLVSNAAENILAKELNLPINPKPFCIKQEPMCTPTPLVPTQNPDRYVCLNNGPQNNQFVQTKTTPSSLNKPPQSEPSPTRTQFNRPLLSEQMIIDECDNLLEIERELEMEQVQHKTSINHFANDSDTDVFDGIDIDNHLDLIDLQIVAKKSRLTAIKELGNVANKNVTIKGKFKKVSGKLKMESKQWSLRIVVEDDTGEIEAWVHSDVITKLINCSPETVLALKEDIQNKKTEASNLMLQKINELRGKIEQLDCEMELSFMALEQYPTITTLN